MLYNDATYVLVDTPEKLDAMLEGMQTARVRAIDVETSGLSVLDDYITGISVSWQEGTGYYIPINHAMGKNLPQEETIEKLRASFEDPNIINIAHGKKFDGTMLAALDFDPEWASSHPDYATDLWLTAYGKELGIDMGDQTFHRFGLQVTFQYDTMIMAYLTGKYAKIGTGRSTASLKKIVNEELQIQMVFIEELFQKASGAKVKKSARIKFETLDPNEDIPVGGGKIVKPYEYACADSDMTLRLFNRLYPRVKDLFLLKVDLGVLPLTKLMELNGVYANVEKMNETYKRLTAEAAKVQALVYRDVGEALGSTVKFDLSSPNQVGEILFEKLNYPVIERSEKTGKPLTNAKVLDVMGKDFPLVANILTWRSLRKNAEDFFMGMQDYINKIDGRIHCSYATAHVSSGRFASESPNMQNQPRLTKWKVFDKELPAEDAQLSDEGYKYYEIKSNLRRCYEAPADFYMLEGDYSQVEYRVFAGRSQARALLDAYRDNADLHTRNASMIFGIPESEVTKALRTEAKTYSFGIMYGMAANGIALRTGRSKEECQMLYNRYFEAIPEGRQHIRDITDAALQNGFVTTHFGRVVYIPELKSDSRNMRFRGEREAFNITIQGCINSTQSVITLEDGLVCIGDLVKDALDVDDWQFVAPGTGVQRTVWNGTDYVTAHVVYSGMKQLVNTTFSDGSTVGTSPEHKFLREDAARNRHWRAAKDLHVFDNADGSKCNNPDRICMSSPVVSVNPDSFTTTQVKFPDAPLSRAHNANGYDANDLLGRLTPFEFGCLLGRLASDGNVQLSEHGGRLTWLVAEHEFPVLGYLKSLLDKVGWGYAETAHNRENRSQVMYGLVVYSKSLAHQLLEVDIRNRIPQQISCNVESLRGYLRGYIDGDGGVSGTGVSISFGKYDCDVEQAKGIQRALKFFGSRTYLDRWEDSVRLKISGYYNQVFLREIGFINPSKASKLSEVTAGKKKFRHTQTVQCVEVTNDFVPMFDVVNSPNGQYVADGVVVHNTAADILRIGMNRLTKRLILQYGPRFNDRVKPCLTTHDSLSFMVHRSIHPDAIVKLLQDSCEVAITDFPHIAMEFAVGKNYGEMVGWEELRPTFDPNDENLGVGSETTTLDENIEYLEDHTGSVSEPSTSGHKSVADVLPVTSSLEEFSEPRSAAVPVPAAEPYTPTTVTQDPTEEPQTFSLIVNEELTQDKVLELRDLLVRHPGKNTLTLLIPDGEVPMTGFPTSLGKKNEALFQVVLQCQLVQTTVSPQALTKGITF